MMRGGDGLAGVYDKVYDCDCAYDYPPQDKLAVAVLVDLEGAERERRHAVEVVALTEHQPVHRKTALHIRHD
eukprot:3199459-Pyramimonas_sp.AAC.1